MFVNQVDLDVIIWRHTWTSELNDADWILRLIIADQKNGKGCVITINRLNWIWLKVKMTTILVDICTRCCLVLNISNNSCTMVYTFITETSACTLPETIYAVITAAHCHFINNPDINDEINSSSKKGVLFTNVLNVKYKIF